MTLRAYRGVSKGNEVATHEVLFKFLRAWVLRGSL